MINSARKQGLIIKKFRDTEGVWRFVSLDRAAKKFVWGDRPGVDFLEWLDGRRSRWTNVQRSVEAQRRKRYEVTGETLTKGKAQPSAFQ